MAPREAASVAGGAEEAEERWLAVRCWHCRSVVRVQTRNTKYWRCGVCRRVNGRPAYARGAWAGVAQCGLCRFYASRLVHVVAISLIVGIVGFALGWALPLASASYSVATKTLVWSVSVALSANVVYHFCLAARSDPGRVPRLSRERWARLVADDQWEKTAGRLPWCEVCDNLKPPRAHHCSTCSTCVVEMDHHCVFLHNCVGAGNMAYFARLLLSLLAGTTYATTYAASLVGAAFLRGTSDLRAVALIKIARRHASAIAAIPETSRYIVNTRDGRYLVVGAVCAGVMCGIAVLSFVTLRAFALGETALERSARLWRAGPDYRHKRPALSRIARDLFRARLSPSLDRDDLAAAVAAKLLDDDRAALDRHLDDDDNDGGGGNAKQGVGEATEPTGCFLRRKKRA